MRIETEIKLDYSDVLIRPKRSTLTSQSKVSLERDFGYFNGIPIMASNLDTTGTFEVADVLERYRMFICLHQHYEVVDLVKYFATVRGHSAYSMGITEADLAKWDKVKSKVPEGNIRFVYIDDANGYTERFINFVQGFCEANKDLTVIAGNVVSGDIAEQLVIAGAHLVKVGIGPGSVCTTRIKTGVGYPQLSAIIECSDAVHGLGGRIVADGGCTSSGDVVKDFGGNADFVMLGGMLAGHDESGGEDIVESGVRYKTFYGMSSKHANDQYAGGLEEYLATKAREVTILHNGPIESTKQDNLGGLRSTLTYIGSRNLCKLSKYSTFVCVINTHDSIYYDQEIQSASIRTLRIAKENTLNVPNGTTSQRLTWWPDQQQFANITANIALHDRHSILGKAITQDRQDWHDVLEHKDMEVTAVCIGNS